MAITRPSELNRKQRKDLTRRLQSADPGLEVMHPNAAGSTWATARTTSPSDPIEIPNRSDGLTASRLISIASPIGSCSVA